MPRTVSGRAASSASAGNGRNSRTVSTPVRWPRRFNSSTVSARVPDAEPITITTRSASGAPW